MSVQVRLWQSLVVGGLRPRSHVQLVSVGLDHRVLLRPANPRQTDERFSGLPRMSGRVFVLMLLSRTHLHTQQPLKHPLLAVRLLPQSQ